MLLELRAENYTVIDRAEVQFGPGLNLLTGETGAGKSILNDALVLLLGGKASTDVVRHGEERATLACVFEATPAAEEILEANGIDAEESTIHLRREITLAGKGRVFINNQPATVAVLRQLGPELAAIHAQSETTSSFDATQQRLLLDRFGGLDLGKVRAAYAAWQATSRRVEELATATADRVRMADLWRFQSSEIAEAGIDGGEEDVRLEAEKRILANAERLYTAAMTAHELLYEAEQSAETTVGSALRQVEELARFDPRFVEAVQRLAEAKASIEDVAASVRDFAEGVQASPDRLSEIEDRLASLERLKRKYGPSLAEVMAFGEDARAKLNEVENRDELVEELQANLKRQAEVYRAEATSLNVCGSARRRRLESSRCEQSWGSKCGRRLQRSGRGRRMVRTRSRF